MIARSHLWSVLRLLISLSLLTYLLATTEWDEIRRTLETARPLYLFIFLALTPLSVYLSTMKWKMLLEVHGSHVPTTRLFSLYIIGMFYNHILPSSIGGDVIRIRALKPYVPSLQTALGSVFVERLTGLFVLTLFGAFALIAWPDLHSHLLVIGIITASAFVQIGIIIAIVTPGMIGLLQRLFGGTSLGKKLLSKLENAHTYMGEYFANPDVLTRCLILSLVFYSISILNVYLVAVGIGDWIALWKSAVATPVIQLVSMLPIAINGIGLTEWAFSYSFEALNLSASTGLAVALIIRARNMVWASLGYGFLSTTDTFRNLTSEQPKD